MHATGSPSLQSRDLPPLVLIVSSNWAWASSRRLLLKQHGCTAVVATELGDVFQFLTIQTFHLVIVDVKATSPAVIDSIYRLRDVDRDTRFVAAVDDVEFPPVKRLLRARCLDGTVARDFTAAGVDRFLSVTAECAGESAVRNRRPTPARRAGAPGRGRAAPTPESP